MPDVYEPAFPRCSSSKFVLSKSVNLSMRLLIVSSEFPPGPGGLGTHAYELAAQLSRIGWEVIVLTSQDYASKDEVKAFNDRQQFRVVTFRSLPGAPIEGMFRYIAYRRIIKEFSP